MRLNPMRWRCSRSLENDAIVHDATALAESAFQRILYLESRKNVESRVNKENWEKTVSNADAIPTDQDSFTASRMPNKSGKFRTEYTTSFRSSFVPLVENLVKSKNVYAAKDIYQRRCHRPLTRNEVTALLKLTFVSLDASPDIASKVHEIWKIAKHRDPGFWLCLRTVLGTSTPHLFQVLEKYWLERVDGQLMNTLITFFSTHGSVAYPIDVRIQRLERLWKDVEEYNASDDEMLHAAILNGLCRQKHVLGFLKAANIMEKRSEDNLKRGRWEPFLWECILHRGWNSLSRDQKWILRGTYEQLQALGKSEFEARTWASPAADSKPFVM